MSAAALGGLVGSLLYTRYPIGERHPEATLLVSLAATAVPIVLVPLVDAVWPMLALFVLMGLCNGPMFCSLLVVRDREAPAEVRTQVFTIGAGLRSTAAAAGAAAAGALAGAGVTPLLLGVAACQLGGALLGGLVLRRPTTVPSVGTWRSS